MVITKGLGGVESPHVFAKMTLEEYVDAYQFLANYKNMPPEERQQALKDDYKAIQSANKKASKDKNEGGL